MGHSHKRSVTACPFWTASSRSRIFGTAFRSLTTTLAPPLRGLCSWPAPSNPCRISSRNRSIPSSSAPFGFEAEPGRRQCPEPVFRADLQRSRIFPDLHSPSGPLTTTFRIKAFNRFPYREARLTKRSIALHSPQLLFRYASDRRSELASSSLTYRSAHGQRKPPMNPDPSIEPRGGRRAMMSNRGWHTQVREGAMPGGGGKRTRVLRSIIGPSPSAAGDQISGPLLATGAGGGPQSAKCPRWSADAATG